MMLSVLIPTHGRPDLLARCLRSLTKQETADFDVEVIVGVDGIDTGEVESARGYSLQSIPMRAEPSAHSGPAATKNRIMRQASGEVLLFLNDDIEAAPGLLMAHATAQLERPDTPAMILGSAPWSIEHDDRLIDRLVRETSLVFFYDQMVGEAAAAPLHDWGWRHAWTLNLSVPSRCANAIGGFCESMRHPVYEDIEFAFRLQKEFSAPTLYRPDAEVVHHHRYEVIELLAREYVLGHQSVRLAEISPDCARAVFKRNPIDGEVAACAQREVSEMREVAEQRIAAFIESAEGPGDQYDDQGIAQEYQKYVKCRSYLRAMGLADAGRGAVCDPPVQWLEKLSALVSAR